jgi:hypothetical protein
VKIIPVKDRPLFFWAVTKRGEGLVTGVTPLGFLAIRIEGRMKFIAPSEVID